MLDLPQKLKPGKAEDSYRKVLKGGDHLPAGVSASGRSYLRNSASGSRSTVSQSNHPPSAKLLLNVADLAIRATTSANTRVAVTTSTSESVSLETSGSGPVAGSSLATATNPVQARRARIILRVNRPQTTESNSGPLAAAPTSRTTMSSQRSRPGRSNARGGSHDIFSPQALWTDFYRNTFAPLMENESRAKQLGEKIIEMEARMKLNKESGAGNSLKDIDDLSALYREQVKLSEEQRSKLDEGMRSQLTLMADLTRTEQAAAKESARASSSRTSGMDFDGPSDSPMPSPADNRQIKKLGTSRTGSQPPSRPEGTPSEASERTSKPKIVYAQNEEVAFKRKTPGKPEEQDWILGKVVRVIGEGKSRRYDVEDPFPDTNASSGPVIYKSSASQMVPIPPEGAPLEDYEIGKRVLALYPDTTTFYRAEVKAMLDGGANVQLLFEDEAAGELKVVTRRLVLDHKG